MLAFALHELPRSCVQPIFLVLVALLVLVPPLSQQHALPELEYGHLFVSLLHVFALHEIFLPLAEYLLLPMTPGPLLFDFLGVVVYVVLVLVAVLLLGLVFELHGLLLLRDRCFALVLVVAGEVALHL